MSMHDRGMTRAQLKTGSGKGTDVADEHFFEIVGSRDMCRAEECPMGNLVADAMLDRVKDQGIDVAISNGGGLRASIDAGEVEEAKAAMAESELTPLARATLEGRLALAEDRPAVAAKRFAEAVTLAPDHAPLRLLWAHALLRAGKPEAVAKAEWARLAEADLQAARFAWAGAEERGGPHYYRVLGPSFLAEYDNTQNDANHIHAVWRDLNNDFGEDILLRHYREGHA